MTFVCLAKGCPLPVREAVGRLLPAYVQLLEKFKELQVGGAPCVQLCHLRYSVFCLGPLSHVSRPVQCRDHTAGAGLSGFIGCNARWHRNNL